MAWAYKEPPAAATPSYRVALARIGGKVVAVAQPAAHLALSSAARLASREIPVAPKTFVYKPIISTTPLTLT